MTEIISRHKLAENKRARELEIPNRRYDSKEKRMSTPDIHSNINILEHKIEK